VAGWTETLDGVRTYNDLPANARRYLERLEHYIGVPVKIVSIGAARHQTLIR
jgi:adenylosuccinate synthase